MITLPKKLIVVLASVIIALSQWTWPARASASVHFISGDRVGEASPSAPGVHVEREELTIDLRGVEHSSRLVSFRVRYRLRNDGPAQTVQITPVAAGTPSLRVTLRNPAAESVKVHAERGVFALPLVPGEQDLEISFQARPDIVPLGELHGFGVDYDLVGAQGWASLGPLMLEIITPAGWKFVERPSEATPGAQPDHYRAQFERYPSGYVTHIWPPENVAPHPERPDLLRLQIEPPPILNRVLWGAHILVLLLTLLVPVIAVRRLRRKQDAGPGVPLLQRLLRALAWTPVIVALPLAALYLHARLLPYIGSFTVMFVVTLATWIVGVAYCWFGHAVAARQPRMS